MEWGKTDGRGQFSAVAEVPWQFLNRSFLYIIKATAMANIRDYKILDNVQDEIVYQLQKKEYHINFYKKMYICN